MAYSTSNPPSLLTDRVMGGGAIWNYESADVATTVAKDGYITNGFELGIKGGDIMNVVTSTETGGVVTATAAVQFFVAKSTKANGVTLTQINAASGG